MKDCTQVRLDETTGRQWLICLLIVGECLLGGLLTAWAYTGSLDEHFSPTAFLRPAVFQISSVTGLLIGAAYSPLVCLCMRHLRLRVRAGCYLLTMLAAVLFELWLGWGIVASVLVLLGLCAICAFTQRLSLNRL